MRVSIIPEDKKIIVDGKTVDLEDDAPWDFDDETIHAIQWKDGRGSLEYEDIPGENPIPNKIFGEEEFDTIVQPYLDYFNTFLTLYEQKELAAALAEEENLAKQIEELNLDKLEKEAQLVIIEDLQKQNKELRTEKSILEDEKSREEQAAYFDMQTQLAKLEREKAARDSEYSALEAQKAEQFFKNKSIELSEKYDELLESFESEKEQFIDERKQYQELLQMERDKMEKESEMLEKEILEDEKKAQQKREFEQQLWELDKEQLEISKADLEMQKEQIKVIEYENSKVFEERELQVDKIIERLQKYEQEIIDLRSKLTDSYEERVEVSEQMLEQLNYEGIMNQSIADEFKTLELEYRQKQSELIANKQKEFSDRNKELTAIIESTPTEEVETNSVDDILNLIDQIDPQQLYTTLTNDERKDNELPVDKAVKWFAELKKVIDENQS